MEPVEQPLEPKKERKKTDNPKEGWEDGTPPPHRDFKERRVSIDRSVRVSHHRGNGRYRSAEFKI